MEDDTRLFGKSCNTEFSIIELQTLANRIGLITTRQNNNQLCNGLRTYFDENGIQNEDELDRHIPGGPTIISETSTRILGENIDLDILFNSSTDHFLKEVEYFQNLKNYSSQMERLDGVGLTNSNGIIYKLKYIVRGKQPYSVILKVNQGGESDNLVYEYLVGQCINEYSRYYPCFSKTYLVGMFSEPVSDNFRAFMKLSVPKSFDTYIQSFDVRNIERLIINGCRSNEFLTLFTQYIPIKYSLEDYLKKYTYPPSGWKKLAIRNDCIDQLYELTTILHIIYQLLSSFADKFTHYDLHMANVVLTEVPDNRFIHVIFHYPDGRILHYNMCFVNCKQMNASKPNSVEIMKIVCNNDTERNPENPFCRHTCGNLSGYHYSTNLDETSEFLLASAENNFIDYTRKNISHDCRLMHEILYYFDFNHLPKDNFIVENLVIGIFDNLAKMYNRFGTYEQMDESDEDESDGDESFSKPINNVIVASDKLTEIISQPEFNIHNDSLLHEKKLYGTLQIWTDLSRPFEFS